MTKSDCITALNSLTYETSRNHDNVIVDKNNKKLVLKPYLKKQHDILKWCIDQCFNNQEVIVKATPMQVIIDGDDLICPGCGELLDVVEDCCYICGQHLDWGI